MKNTCILSLATLLLAMPMTTQGQSTVFDFEHLASSPPSGLFGFVDTPFHQDGFVLDAQPGSFLRSIHPTQFGGQPSRFFAGSIAVFNDYLDDSTSLREENVRPFRLESVALSRVVNNDVTLNFTGLTDSGDTVTTSFFRDGLSENILTTEFFPPNFTDLVEVRWEQEGGSMQFDDLTVTVVPEPTTCFMLLLVAVALSATFCHRRWTESGAAG